MQAIPKTLAAIALESIALGFAFALRSALEEIHAKHGEAHGFGDGVLAPMNKRVAHYCYERIRGMDPNALLSTADVARWAEDIWRIGLVEAGLLANPTVPAEDLAAARASVDTCLKSYLAAYLAFLENPCNQTRMHLARLSPHGWDSPARTP